MMHQEPDHTKTTFMPLHSVYISRSAILHNFDVLSKLTNKQVIPVLKANAYGHGITEVAQILNQRSMPYIAVNNYDEAEAVQVVSKHQVLIMGAIDPNNYQLIDFSNISLVIFTVEAVAALAALGKPIRIHLEIDTGMRRHGVRPEHLNTLLGEIKRHPQLELEGVMTHLSDSDNPDDIAYTQQQITDFDSCVEQVFAAGFKPSLIHAGQSAGSTKDSSTKTNTIRPGLALYGLSPLEASDPESPQLGSLQPALTLTSRVGAIQNIKAGDSVSYNRTFQAPHDMRLAIMPLGYYEALPRRLGAHKQRFGDQEQYSLVARICMNHHMLDITNTDVAVGDEITIYSPNKQADNAIQSIANKLDYTNTYELAVAINQNMQRNIIE